MYICGNLDDYVDIHTSETKKYKYKLQRWSVFYIQITAEIQAMLIFILTVQAYINTEENH
jgi:hypothetical protein